MDSIIGKLIISVVLYFAIFIRFAKFTMSLQIEQCLNINLAKADGRWNKRLTWKDCNGLSNLLNLLLQ